MGEVTIFRSPNTDNVLLILTDHLLRILEATHNIYRLFKIEDFEDMQSLHLPIPITFQLYRSVFTRIFKHYITIATTLKYDYRTGASLQIF